MLQVPQDIYDIRGGNGAFYYYDDYTVKASMSLEPIKGTDWPTGSERLPGDTWDPKLPALVHATRLLPRHPPSRFLQVQKPGFYSRLGATRDTCTCTQCLAVPQQPCNPVFWGASVCVNIYVSEEVFGAPKTL